MHNRAENLVSNRSTSAQRLDDRFVFAWDGGGTRDAGSGFNARTPPCIYSAGAMQRIQ
jgi:hypothetical protein